MSNTSTVSRLIPLRVLRKVLPITTLSAFVTLASNLRVSKAWSAIHEISLTSVRVVKLRTERRVKLVKVKDFPMVVMLSLPKVRRSPASSAIKFPVISLGPLMMIEPEASGEIRTSPLIVEQPVYCAAWTWLVIVAVAWEQMDWARLRI